MPTLTIPVMVAKLKSIGLTRKYKPFNDPANAEREEGREVILLECRKPAKIVDGLLKGAEIDIYDDSTVRVWTNQKQKATAIAKANGFRSRLLDGEAEIFIPVDKADMFLHALGAKVKKTVVHTPEQTAALRERMSRIRKDRKVPEAAAV